MDAFPEVEFNNEIAYNWASSLKSRLSSRQKADIKREAKNNLSLMPTRERNERGEEKVATAEVHASDFETLKQFVSKTKEALEAVVDVPVTVDGYFPDIRMTSEENSNPDVVRIKFFHENLLAEPSKQEEIANMIAGDLPDWAVIMAFCSVGPWLAKVDGKIAFI